MAFTGDKTLRLRDGRILAYTEHGDLSGKPVVVIHGNPGSRNVRHPDESITQRLGARVITPDRPGYGLSEYQAGRTLLDFPDDISQLMDALHIDQFTVLGVSAGGPYAASCAYKLGKRVYKTAIVSPTAPIDRENPYEGVHPSIRKGGEFVQKYPAWISYIMLSRQIHRQLRHPDSWLAKASSILSYADRAILAIPEIKRQMLNYRYEAVRQGVQGMLREMQILVSPWGFPLEAIDSDVHIWHWEEDYLIPIQMGRYLASKIPSAQSHFLPGGGHYSIFNHWSEILQEVM